MADPADEGLPERQLTSIRQPLRTAQTVTATTVLVTVPDDRRRRELTDQLQEAGFTVRASASWTAAVELLAEYPVDIGIVDDAVSDYYTDPPGLTQGGGPVGLDQPGEIPIIFLVGDPSRFDWDAYAQLDRAEIIATSVVATQLVPRICALARRRQRQRTERRVDDRLRVAVQEISASIRTSNEPTVITERLIRGISEAFDVDLVHLTTLRDDRVPELALEWSRETGLRPLEMDRHRPAIRIMAELLWKGGTAYQINHRAGPPAPPELAELAAFAFRLGPESSISVAVGGGDAPFGLLWLADTRRRRSWSSTEAALLHDLAANVAHGMMQGQVITDQQEVLRRLERLDRAKSNFLATVNHELRTPLTSLTAYLDLIQDGTAGPLPPRASEMLAVADRNARRLGSLIDDVLTVSRLAVDDPEVAWAPVDLTSLTHRVVDRLRKPALAHDIHLAARVPEEVVVDGDAGHLEQVIYQLVDNALKFTGTGGQVEVEISEREGLAADECTVRVAITDTGVGIPVEEVSDLFTSFFRGSNAQASAVAGSGLGLAIVSGLVEAHRGWVTVDATASGGTRVCVELPKTRRGGLSLRGRLVAAGG